MTDRTIMQCQHAFSDFSYSRTIAIFFEVLNLESLSPAANDDAL